MIIREDNTFIEFLLLLLIIIMIPTNRAGDVICHFVAIAAAALHNQQPKDRIIHSMCKLMYSVQKVEHWQQKSLTAHNHTHVKTEK